MGICVADLAWDPSCLAVHTRFYEPRVGKARAKRQKGDWEGPRAADTFILLAGAAAITVFSSSCHSSGSNRRSMFSPLVADPVDTAVTHSNTGELRREQPVTKQVSHDTHAQCQAGSQLLHSHHLQYVG